MLSAVVKRPLLASVGLQSAGPVSHIRFRRREAFGAELDQDAVAEAREWHQQFDATQLPQGNTTYARSSGPGGQHVNK